MKTPCKDCDRRQIGCHSMCRDYMAWKDDFQKRKENQPEAPDMSREKKRYLWRRMLGR